MRVARATVAVLLATAAMAQPARVVHQGFLVDSGGDPVTDTVDLHFKLYATQSGGAAVWSEAVPNVNVAAGSFAVELSLSEADLVQQNLWLSVAVGDPSQELPRTRVGSVPFALRGASANTLDEIPAAGWQRRIVGTCPMDQAISLINPDGTVGCAADDATGVGDVVGGLGLIESGYPDVLLEVSPGEGLTIVGDALRVDFDADGALDLVARADHNHAGAFLPAGMSTSCTGGEKIVSIDPMTGNVTCAPDAFTNYSASMGLAMTPDGSGLFDQLLDTQPNIAVNGVTSESYYVFPSQYQSVSLDAADFKPEFSSNTSYVAIPGFGGRFSAQGTFNVVAGIPLPHGVNISGFYWYYEITNPAVDSILCEFRYVNQFVEGDAGGWWSGYGDIVGGVQQSGGGLGGIPISPVNNDLYIYFARCEINETAPVNEVRLVGYRVEYEYGELGR